MKHIYLFDERSRASVYGIGTYISQLGICLDNMQDISLYIIRLRSDEQEFKREYIDGHVVYSFPDINTKYTGKYYKYYRNIWFILSKHIHIADKDELFFHLNYSKQHHLIEFMKKAYPNCRTLLTIHYQNWCFALSGNASYFKKIVHNKEKDITKDIETDIISFYEEEKKIFTKIDHLICLSEFTRKILMNEYRIPVGKISLIYNGLKDGRDLLSKEKKNRIKRNLFFNEQEKIILFVGRIDKIKGLDVAIKSFKYVFRKLPYARLLIVGDGDYSIYLKECNGYWSRITFTGRLEKEDLYKIYQIADVGVMPSTNEQCSYVGIEMMMFGLPMITTTSTGLSEMLTGENAQYKIKAKEKEEEVIVSPIILKNKIIKSFSDKKYSERLRKQYEDKYTLEKMKIEYISMYNKIYSTSNIV
jgi:glycosyltransferase